MASPGAIDEQPNWSQIVDKRGEVAALRVEKATGIQSKLPLLQRTPNRTVWRFGKFEKSKDPSVASWPSTFGGSVGSYAEIIWNREGVVFTICG